MSSISVSSKSMMKNGSTVTSTEERSRRRSKPETNRTIRVRKTDLLMVTTQLTIMCRAGVDLAGALTSIASDCRHPGLKQVLSTVSRDVNSGMPASVALTKHSQTFGETYVASLAAAEASGKLTEVLERMCLSLKNEIRTQNAIASIVAYPIVLMGVAGVVATTLVFFVLPQFSIVFKNMGRPAPPLTQMLLDSATFLRTQVVFVVGGVVLSAVFLFQLSRTDDFKRWWDRLVLNAPFLRDATRSVFTGRTFRLLGSLLESGVPLLDALKLCRSAVKNYLFLDMIDNLERDVVNGRGLSNEITKAKFVPAGAAQMVLTAERTGRLGSVLQIVGEHYEEEGEQLVRRIAKLVEPAVIVLMGIVVGTVVLCVMLPLLDVTTVGH